MTENKWQNLVERLRENAGPLGEWGEKADALQLEAAAEIERLSVALKDVQAQVERYEEHYQAAMGMSEKHRKLWVGCCKEIKLVRAVLVGLQKIGARPWMDGGVTWPEWDQAMTKVEMALNDAVAAPESDGGTQ